MSCDALCEDVGGSLRSFFANTLSTAWLVEGNSVVATLTSVPVRDKYMLADVGPSSLL